MVNKSAKKSNRVKKRAGPNGDFVESICSVTDPFCHHAEGALSPAGCTIPTFPLTFRGVQSYGSGAAGDLIIMFGTDADESNSSAATTSSSTFSNYGVQVGTFPSFVDEVRLVSAGIRWWTPLAATAAGGSLAVTPLPSTEAGLNTTTSNQWTNSPYTEIMNLRCEGQYNFRAVDNTAFEFRAPGTSGTVAQRPTGFDAVVLTISGPASTACLMVEWVYHWECSIANNQSMSVGRPRHPDPVAKQAMKTAGFYGAFSGTAAEVSKELRLMARQAAIQAARIGFSKGIELLGNYVVPGSGRIAGGGALMLTNAIDLD